MAEVNSRGRKPERQYHATRLVVDDYGDAVGYEWRCASCLRWQSHRDKGWCQTCSNWGKRARLKRVPEIVRERQRRQRRDRLANDPGARERERQAHARAIRARMERDPKRERMLSTQRNKRYRAKLKTDRERHQVVLDQQRIRYVIRRQEAGLPTGNGGRRINGTGSTGVRRYVPAPPLAFAVARALHRFPDGEPELAEQAGVSDRLLRCWRQGERRTATWDSADRVLVALDRFWWEVFDPEDAPAGLFSGERSRDLVAWLEAALMATELWGDDD